MLSRIYGQSENHARILNIGLLIGGYGFGQGSIFLAQTWLLAQGELELLALFGTHFAFAMLGIIVVEAGSLISLARHVARLPHDGAGREEAWRRFWETTIFRTGVALGVIAVVLAGALIGSFGDFTRNYALCAAPAFLIWALNAAGFLDGLKFSGMSGISGSVAYASSALALLLVQVQGAPAPVAGMVLGSAFSLGYAATIAIQFVALQLAGWQPRFARPRRDGIAQASRDGLVLLGSALPGQLYFRAQLLMSSAWLGAEPTALFVYVKQILNAANHLIGFIRRVEFPTLVRLLNEDRSHALGKILRTQRLGTGISIAGTFALLMSGSAMAYWGTPEISEAGFYLALFSLFVATGSLILGLVQGLSALGLYKQILFRTSLAVLSSLIVSYFLISHFGLLAFFLGEIASAMVSLIFLLFYIRKIGAPSKSPA